MRDLAASGTLLTSGCTGALVYIQYDPQPPV
jgi:hypothetical protein